MSTQSAKMCRRTTTVMCQLSPGSLVYGLNAASPVEQVRTSSYTVDKKEIHIRWVNI